MHLSNFKKVKLPDAPGVYFFKAGSKILYIGKATSLRDRVKSYFSKDLMLSRGLLIVQMIDKASTVDFIQTDSVLEALILEANLIKKHQPPHNTLEKDDKSYNYIVITREDYPRVLVVRGKDLPTNFAPEERLYLLGPFPRGSSLKEAMKIIRKIFPYRDTCTPNVGKACFNAQIGLCSGICAGTVSKTDYKKIVRNLILFLNGKKKNVITAFKKEMSAYSHAQKFELANSLKKRLFALQHIDDVVLLKRASGHKAGENTYRIEAYDVAHLSGKDMVGVMVVVENGVAKKEDYRKFKINTVSSSNDAQALREVLSRRLKHSEWGIPNLIVVDGNVVQLNVAHDVIKSFGIESKSVAVTKDERHRAREVLGMTAELEEHRSSIIFANAEAHRFSIAYHRRKRASRFILSPWKRKK